MPDASNPTHRVIDVINFLAAHPMESFTLAEIARNIGLSNGSAHRILTTLAGAQYLARNEKHRTYTLGMALVAIGQASIEKHRGVEIARREIARLAVELNVQCSASAIIDDEILVLVKEGAAQSHHGVTRVGERRPLVPPLGICHIAWGDDAAITAYLDKAGASLGEAARDRLSAAFPVIRQRGFAIAAAGSASEQVGQAMFLPSGQERDADYWSRVGVTVAQLAPDEVQLLDLNDVGGRALSYISAPVFSATSAVALQLVLSGLPGGLSVRELEAHAERLCGTAAVITAETHGRKPQGRKPEGRKPEDRKPQGATPLRGA